VEGNGFDGIIPGAGGDIAAMNPLKIMNGLVLDGIPPCQAWTCPTTDIQTGVDQGPQTKFLSTSLEFNMSPCTASTASETAKLLAIIRAEKKAAEKVAKDAADAEAAKTKAEADAKARAEADARARAEAILAAQRQRELDSGARANAASFSLFACICGKP
jgi:hypothetical protein